MPKRRKKGNIIISHQVQPEVEEKPKEPPKKPMRIELEQDVFAKLEAARTAARGQEVSGFGFVEVDNNDKETVFTVYDVVVLDVGSTGFTEIPAEKILPLLDRSDAGKMKLWWHVHPLGGYTPGPNNWSGTDNRTAEEEPLGGMPELVKWSISIVRTPKAWVGRFDKYSKEGVYTRHLSVSYGVEKPFVNEVRSLYKAYKLQAEAEAKSYQQALGVASQQSPFSYLHPRRRGSVLLRCAIRLKNIVEVLVSRIGITIG